MADEPSKHPVALITGASGGIGEALAYKVGGDGYKLVLVARNSEALNRVAGVIATKLDIETVAIPMDLTEPRAAAQLDIELRKRDLVPDLVINNAGFGLRGAAADLDHDAQINMIDLNVRTLTELSLRHASQMKQRGKGGIINISSTAGYIPGPHMAVYYATKAYVSSFTEALGVEMKRYGVQVTSVVPGVTATDFQTRAGMEEALLVKAAPSMTAEQVAEIAYTGFKKRKRVVITGGLNRLVAYMFRVMPRRLLLPILSRMQG